MLLLGGRVLADPDHAPDPLPQAHDPPPPDRRLPRPMNVAAVERGPELVDQGEQLLTILSKAGFIKSKRGPQGGHLLTKPPTQITLNEIVAALEGLTPPISCIENPADCSQAATCAQRDVWRATEEAAQKVLKATTLAQLAQNQQRRQREGMYYI